MKPSPTIVAAAVVCGGIAGAAIMSYRTGGAVGCRTSDMTSGNAPESVETMEATQGAWIHRTRECRIGEYLVIVPADGRSGEVFLARNGQPLFFASPNLTTVLDSDGKRVLFEAGHNRPGALKDIISYTAFDPVQAAWVESNDFGADGTVDFRSTQIAGRPLKREFRVGERWLEVVARDGKDGTILDGEFMSGAEARLRLSAAETPHPGRIAPAARP